MWNETNAQNDKTIELNVHFPDNQLDSILSGTHIGLSNPLFKSARGKCLSSGDFDVVDLFGITKDYRQRCKYRPGISSTEYRNRSPVTIWGDAYLNCYRLVSRKMLNLSQERTLISAVIPPFVGHINGLIGFACKDLSFLAYMAGLFASLPYDFFVKTVGKTNFYESNAGKLAVVVKVFEEEIMVRALKLNCLTQYYAPLWEKCYSSNYKNMTWAKTERRLNNLAFSLLEAAWSVNTASRSDYERRELLIELDVLVAMSLGMSLNQLKTIYSIQFPVLSQNENDTWYDANGRIVFTTNRSLVGIGFERKEWENGIKGAPAGKKFYRTIIDDTMPGGPVERTIEYVAPFDRCDREQDYETAWKFFEEKYGKGAK